MSEHEKFEQVGRLAEEYSRLKGELNHVTEKINHARAAYQGTSQAMSNNAIAVGDNGVLFTRPTGYGGPPVNLHALLGFHELEAVYVEQARLTKELEETRLRLHALAPHLV